MTREEFLRVILSFLKDSYSARQVVHAFAERGGNLTRLAIHLDGYRAVLTTAGIPKAYSAARKRADKARAAFEDAARKLLAFYDAPERSYDWMAVYLNVRREGLTVAETTEADRREGLPTTVAERAQHAVRIRAALEPLRRDRAYLSRPEKRAPHRPRTRAGLVDALRKLELSKGEAETILSAIK